MNELGFEFEHPWVLIFLALLPLYSWLRGKSGQAAALLYPDVGLLRAVSSPVREAAGSLRVFLRLATVAALIVAIAGPRTVSKEIERETEGLDIMLVVDDGFRYEHATGRSYPLAGQLHGYPRFHREAY